MIQNGKKHIITIAGRPGSGKSTTSKMLAKQLGYTHFSSGDLFRAIAKERGLDVHKANLDAEKNASNIDKLVDQKLRDIGREQDNFVIDSRLAWHWIPYSFKVFLDLDLDVAARRIISNMEPERLVYEHIPNDAKAYADELRGRLASESRRYQAFYKADPNDISNFDLVVDTEKNNPQQVMQIIQRSYEEWLTKNPHS